MTDLDECRMDIQHAAGDTQALRALASELHHLRHLRRVAIGRGRRLDAVTYTAARTAPRPQEIDPPQELGSSRDLLRQPVTA